MTRSRSQLAGMTDYTGVDLDSIVAHLREWRDMTKETVSALHQLRRRVDEEAQSLENPEDIQKYIDYFIDLFERYYHDFQRLVSELPAGVRDTHIEIISQINRSSRSEDDHCREFRGNHINRELTNEGARPLLDEIYHETRSTIIDYSDLSNLIPRLRTYVGPPSSGESKELLQLRPTFYGISVDLKQIARRFREWWKKKQNEK